MNVLIIGGSGFLSGTLARCATTDGHNVWALTRGSKALPEGVQPIIVDRHDSVAFAKAISATNTNWDLVIDCIAFTALDAQQDVDVLAGKAGHLILISTDSVISPVNRPWMIDETYDEFDDTEYAQGKRAAELVLLNPANPIPSTVLRPNHIYGPGSLLGCLPLHGRDPQLIERILRHEAIALVGGGHFLQSPIYAADLWGMSLSCKDNPAANGQVYFAPGPDLIECRMFYRIIAQTLGIDLQIKEISISDDLIANPAHRMFCCHRAYSTQKAKSHGLMMPATPIAVGLPLHVRSITNR